MRGNFPFEAKILPELKGDEKASRLAVLQGEPVVENTPLLHHLGHMVQTYKIGLVSKETWFKSVTETGRPTRSAADPLNLRPQG